MIGINPCQTQIDNEFIKEIINERDSLKTAVKILMKDSSATSVASNNYDENGNSTWKTTSTKSSKVKSKEKTYTSKGKAKCTKRSPIQNDYVNRYSFLVNEVKPWENADKNDGSINHFTKEKSSQQLTDNKDKGKTISNTNYYKRSGSDQTALPEDMQIKERTLGYTTWR